MEALLGNGDTQSAARLLPFASPANRAVYEARLAMQTRAANAGELYAQVAGVQGNGGLLIDRANFLRGRGDSLGARQLLAQPYRLTVKPGAPLSTTSSEMPCQPGPPVRTAVVTKSARAPEVM